MRQRGRWGWGVYFGLSLTLSCSPDPMPPNVAWQEQPRGRFWLPLGACSFSRRLRGGGTESADGTEGLEDENRGHGTGGGAKTSPRR